jgi:hypothetical protein
MMRNVGIGEPFYSEYGVTYVANEIRRIVIDDESRDYGEKLYEQQTIQAMKKAYITLLKAKAYVSCIDELFRDECNDAEFIKNLNKALSEAGNANI